MGDYQAAAERAITKADMFAQYAPSMYFVMSETFGRGLSLFAMARKTKKRSYEKEANAIRKQVAKWLKAGNPNVEHFYYLLQAEYEALENKHDNADESYRKAIAMAKAGSYLQCIALFHERYSEFLLHVRSCREEAAHHSREAATYFEEWGAMARAREIRESLTRG
ncbi:unnamed protein product [Cylindrotheca closterium]|uniref:Uncharacterized protein n=1 Tax=Cylindrotheca closterium TaxID=2856 RepID=A0AAD2CSH5_9STRA|nr:unnamed protein product [Cylindrotheca closterium]